MPAFNLRQLYNLQDGKKEEGKIGAPKELRDIEFVGVGWRICGDFVDI